MKTKRNLAIIVLTILATLVIVFGFKALQYLVENHRGVLTIVISACALIMTITVIYVFTSTDKALNKYIKNNNEQF